MANEQTEKAFPNRHMTYPNIGMTVRDYVAARAMQSMYNHSIIVLDESEDDLAIAAYRLADSMLRAREQK
jgi:hypothetical protein